MGTKESNVCGMCRLEVDSVEHMPLYCAHTKELRNEIAIWITGLGMVDYNLSESKIIMGDLENALAINSIILNTKESNLQLYEKRTKDEYTTCEE